MKAVIDTNVLISGIFFSGAPSKLLASWRSGRFEVVATPRILAEYQRVAEELSVKFKGVDVSAILNLIAIRAEIVEDLEVPVELSRDPDDDKFLVCAAVAGAVVVTGDKDLLAANGVLGVEVLTTRTFLDRLSRD